MEEDNGYYVYVYIDPRNFEEFYYGKGKGNRKAAHLSDTNDTEKVRIINAIENEGLKPIIKVIAKNLTEKEALLVEKTLIWKLGKNLTNISSGQFADKFRPHNTFHEDLFGFDYENGIYYVNVGEGPHRSWEDCLKYGFLSSGQGKKYSDPLKTLEKGDVVAAYLKNKGYVGVGKVIDKAVRVDLFRVNNVPLFQLPLKCKNIFENSDNDKSEYVLSIKWIKVFETKDAKREKNIFANQNIKASLQNQRKTLDFLEKEFQLDFNKLLLEH